jgi:hypothetical protein
VIFQIALEETNAGFCTQMGLEHKSNIKALLLGKELLLAKKFSISATARKTRAFAIESSASFSI